MKSKMKCKYEPYNKLAKEFQCSFMEAEGTCSVSNERCWMWTLESSFDDILYEINQGAEISINDLMTLVYDALNE